MGSAVVVLNTLPLFLAGAIVLASRLDVALFFTGVVSGQILISLRIDCLGWFEIPMRSLTFERMLGAVLMIGGEAKGKGFRSLAGD